MRSGRRLGHSRSASVARQGVPLSAGTRPHRACGDRSGARLGQRNVRSRSARFSAPVRPAVWRPCSLAFVLPHSPAGSQRCRRPPLKGRPIGPAVSERRRRTDPFRNRKKLVARAGRLVGRPDRFDRTSVTDYKSNLPDPATPFGSEILERYRRQIRIYAAIIAEALGFWPERGIVAGPSGTSITFDLDPSECDAEADRAVQELGDWNGALSSARDALQFANPSASSCQNCRFQLVCPAFWNWLGTTPGLGRTSGAPVAAAGRLKAVQLGNDGDLQTVTLSNVVSTLPGACEVSMVTRRSIHGDAFASPPGTDYRIVGAGLRRDGRLSAEVATVLQPTQQIPEVLLRTDGVAHD
ncbi:PD-(D/E)XK nuclease family protein [Bradyrhizobium guangxiense]